MAGLPRSKETLRTIKGKEMTLAALGMLGWIAIMVLPLVLVGLVVKAWINER